jgi:hypothetical protein
MRFADAVGMPGREIIIDWKLTLTPQITYSIFESWGNREWVPDNNELFYYFYIDNWSPPPKLYLMERAVKHARRLALIRAPQELLEQCVAEQGNTYLDKTYALNEPLKQWLESTVLADRDLFLVERIAPEEEEGVPPILDLPGRGDPLPEGLVRVKLRAKGRPVSEEEVPDILKQHDFYEDRLSPDGSFTNYLVDDGNGLTVSDLRTGLMWQRGGSGITSIKVITDKYLPAMNRERFAGHDGWRLPTMEEALSLVERRVNHAGLHLHPCFSRVQPFIFLADWRQPGGYWFVDFGRAVVFWASGTIPGGFARACRSL